MNPLIKKTIDKIKKRNCIVEGADMTLALEIGNALMEALIASKHNPDVNLNGDGAIDENTLGNFEVDVFKIQTPGQ